MPPVVATPRVTEEVAVPSPAIPPEDLLEEISTVRQEKKVKIDGQVWTLKELVGPDYVRWTSAQSKTMQISTDQKSVQQQGTGDLPPLLISLCLHAPDGTRMTPEAVQKKFYGTGLARLLELCQKLNRFEEKEAEQKKD